MNRSIFSFLGMSIAFILMCSFTSAKKPVVKQGNVIYFFESGKMQCLSEIDSNGQCYILLKSLDKNTTLQFIGLNQIGKGKTGLEVMMLVKEDVDFCANWVNSQKVNILIEPIKVANTSLNDEIIYSKNGYIVMMTPSSK